MTKQEYQEAIEKIVKQFTDEICFLNMKIRDLELENRELKCQQLTCGGHTIDKPVRYESGLKVLKGGKK